MGKMRIKEWMMDHAYLMTIGCILAMIVGCALYTQGVKQAQQMEVQAAAGAPEIQQTVRPTQSVTPLPTIAPLAVRTMVQKGGAWPLEGKILRAYDAQESAFWQALGLWQMHPALDIAGQAGASVKACMDGTVKSVTYDVLWGWRVRIAHEGGRETVYAGLEGGVVQAGDSVRRGQRIGTLAQSVPCEAEMGTHLHLEMIRDGKHQDPEATLEER